MVLENLLTGNFIIKKAYARADRSAKIPAYIFLFVSMVAIAQIGLSENIPLHHFELDCDTCHFSGAGGYDRGEAGEFKGDINYSCSKSGCHDLDSALSHPVGVRPTGIAEPDMPLDQDSCITCLTCHTMPSSPDKDKMTATMLHVPSEAGFCAKCHLKMGGTSMEQSHWQFSTYAHLGPINPNGRHFPNSETFGCIDKESHSCLGCHDTISASTEQVSWSKPARQKDMSDHPIGMSYQDIAARKANRYFPLSNVRQIRLFDGRLGCGSCHSLYSSHQKKLVTNNERSELCVKCHNK